MTVEFRPLAPGQLGTIYVQPEQQLEQVGMILPGYEALLVAGTAMAAFENGRIIAAAGLVPLVPGELSIAWCLLSKRAGRYLASITQRCRAVMDNHPTVRIEMFVNADLMDRGDRWATALGFVRETDRPLRKRGRGGKDQHIYARLKDVRA
jgi:hypothetical protein